MQKPAIRNPLSFPPFERPRDAAAIDIPTIGRGRSSLQSTEEAPMQNIRSAVSGATLGMLVLAASLCSHAVCAQGKTESIWPTQQWQTSTPEEQGMESAALASLLDFGATRSLDSLLL